MNFHATSRRATGAKAVTPQTLIQMAFDDCRGDRQAAAAAVRQAARTSPTLLDHLVDLGAKAAVGNLVCSDRKVAYSGVTGADVTRPRMQRPDTSAHEARVRSRHSLEVRLLLDSTLFGGKIKMRHATSADLLESASRYDAQSGDMKRKAIMHRLVAARLPAGKVVGDVLDDTALTRMWESAGEQIPA